MRTLHTLLLAAYAFAPMAVFGLESSFGNSGKVATPNSCEASALQSDGKIVVTGFVQPTVFPIEVIKMGVARYNSDGTLDETFGGTGAVETQIDGYLHSEGTAVAIQNDGKVVVGGYAAYVDRFGGATADIRYFAARYLNDGTLDPSFNQTGFASVRMGGKCTGIVIDGEGKILLVGWSSDSGGNSCIAMVRFNTNGQLDTTLTGTGYLKVNKPGWTPTGVALQNDGKIVIAANSITALRLNADGSTDSTFASSHYISGDLSYDGRTGAVAIQNDGKILLAGGYSVARLNSDGSLDATFNDTGIALQQLTNALCITSQDDGRIVIAGVTRGRNGSGFGVARYTPNGGLDPTFGNAGFTYTPLAADIVYDDGYLDTVWVPATSVHVQPDNSIIAGGYSRLVRYLATEPATLFVEDDAAIVTDQSVIIDVEANDHGQSSSLDIFGFTQPESGGTTSILSAGEVPLDSPDGHPLAHDMIRFTPDGTLSAPVTFTYSVRDDGVTGTASVTVMPPPESPGSFTGLLKEPDGTVRGKLSARVSRFGVATGTIRLDARTYRFKGRVGALRPLKAVAGKRKSLAFRLAADAADPLGQPSLNATIGGTLVRGLIERSPYNTLNLSPQRGDYLARVKGIQDDVPMMIVGKAASHVGRNGMVRLASRTREGLRLSQGGILLAGGRLAVYQDLFRHALVQRQIGVLSYQENTLPAVGGTVNASVAEGSQNFLISGRLVAQ